MSLVSALQRVAQLETAGAPAAFSNLLAEQLATGTGSSTGDAPGGGSGAALSTLLAGELGGSGTGALSPLAPASTLGSTASLAPASGVAAMSNPFAVGAPAGAGTGNQAIVRIAQGEVGVSEQPPGSNDSPRIATYRQATTGAIAGAPWCAYFVSWAARQAGTPLGDQGEGFGSVDQLWSWAQQRGRAVENGPGVKPQPGDLAVFNEHVGIVTGVLPDGRIQTVEGNYADKVSANVRGANEAVGYVRMS
jgi:CHAP domain